MREDGSCRKGGTLAIRDEVLKELLEGYKKPEDLLGPEGLLKKLTAALVEKALSAEMAEHLGYEKHAVSGRGSGNSRNGTSEKTLKTESGEMPIEVPRDRNGSFEPQLVKKHQTHFDGFDEKIISMYARGMTVREIQGHLQELYGVEVSPDLISRVTSAILEGNKEVLGLWIEETEGAKFWLKILTEIKNRGVEDILILCCDGLKGFPEAIEAVFPKTTIQTCIVHMIRNSIRLVSWKDRKHVVAALKPIYGAQTEDLAEAALTAFESSALGARYPMIARSWRSNWQRVIPFLAFPREVRRIIYTTNAIESLNFSLRKIIKCRGHFPSDEAATKLLYLALIRAEQKWARPSWKWKDALNQFALH